MTKVLTAMFPRQIKAFVSIKFGRFEGINELYRRLYDYYKSSSLEKKIDDFANFKDLQEDEQTQAITEFFMDAFAGDEFILIEDEGAAISDLGDYPAFISAVLAELRGSSRPIVGFVSSRMMPLTFRDRHSSSFFLRLQKLDDEQMAELMSFSLRDSEIDFDDSQLADVCKLLDGHPFNSKLALSAIKNYGLDSFIADPSYLIAWKRRRAEDFLSPINFIETETDIMSALYDYRFLSFPLMKDILGIEGEELAKALRKLEEFCCIERTGTIYSIATPIHDAIGRDDRFDKKNAWKKKIANLICKTIEEYKGEDHVPLSILDAGAIASIRAGKASNIASAMILPSHYLALSKDAYDDDRRVDSIEFAKKAYELRTQLSIDGKIESLRLWGLASIRLSDQKELDDALEELKKLSANRTAKRHMLFLEGFRLRSKKRYDEAEAKFLAAYRLAPRNHSINRELANLYRHQKDFAEAESYARRAYEIAPTNAFIIDIFLETLLGKMHLGIEVDQSEVERLFVELERYGDVPGSSFFQTRVAQDLFRKGQDRQALSAVDSALRRTPDFLPCYFLRADINLSLVDSAAARKDFAQINRILDRRGGFSQEDEARAVEIEIRIFIEEKNFGRARELITRSQHLRKRVYHPLSRKLANAIKLHPGTADKSTNEWAERLLGAPSVAAVGAAKSKYPTRPA